jgi:hypothetical protein
LARLHHALFVQTRELVGKEASPSVAIIDSQSVKSAEKGCWHRPGGLCAGKKVKGKKRHILVDSLGLILTAHWWGSWRSHACNLPGPGKNRRNHCKDLLSERSSAT